MMLLPSSFKHDTVAKQINTQLFMPQTADYMYEQESRTRANISAEVRAGSSV